MMTDLPVTIHNLKGKVLRFIYFKLFFLTFIFPSLNFYCHSKFFTFFLQHLKPYLQKQSGGNERPCSVIYWAITLHEHWYY